MSPYRFETYGELQPWLEREWLLTNGTGSFAMSTTVGCNTRRYHGLLVAATLPPVGRVLALNRIAESISIENEALPVELSVNCFPNAMIPRGDRYLRSFELSDIARFSFDADGVKLTKEVLLVWGKPIVGVRYTIDPGKRKKVELRLQPFVSLRDFHSLRHKGDVTFDRTESESSCTVGWRDQKLHLLVDRGSFINRPDWWYDHTYPIETERGLDDREDLFTPGNFSLMANEATTVTLWASMSPMSSPLDFDAERERAEKARQISPMPTPAQQRLVRSAEQFVCKRNLPDGSQGATVLAGLPWFADWGRDTMISLPGLLLTTRRFQQAGQVLSVFASHVSEGMIPNKFDDYSNEPSYNTVDASL
ncbi:MAG TPA: glycogen debranching enzyme N-terminal domain-containing protein, partial [Tepidisphaeraceae bacterium]|nr:glycogen debranching enzyme N-terminal domain-containing protein [Tepidisphaeraceae bacterium]